MSVIVQILCDQANQYGTCANRSLPGRTDQQARDRAEADGWLVRRDGSALCPGHAGTRRPGGRQ